MGVSELDDELARERRELGTGAKLAIGCAVLFGVPLVLLIAYGFYVARVQTPEDRFAAALEDKPRVAKLVETVKRTYPEEYTLLVKRVDEAGVRNLDEEQLISVIASFAVRMWSRHRSEMAQAGDAEVLALMTAIGRMAALSAKDPVLCRAQFSTVNLVGPEMARGRKASDGMFALAAATVNAAAAGKEHPVKRSMPTAADGEALGRKLQALGLSQPQLLRLQQKSLSDADMQANCDTLDKLFEAILSLPPERIQRLGTQQMREGGA